MANMYSKSVLRAVCGELVEKNPGIDYLPSYESVTVTKKWSVYQGDMIHVTNTFVGKIIEKYSEKYLNSSKKALVNNDNGINSDNLKTVETGSVGDFFTVNFKEAAKTNYLLAIKKMKDKQYNEAIPYLEDAIRFEPGNVKYYQCYLMVNQMMDVTTKQKRCFVFGTGSCCQEMLNHFIPVELIEYFIDNDRNKWDSMFQGKPVFSPERLKTELNKQILILIASQYHDEIAEQLNIMGFKWLFHYIGYFQNIIPLIY